MNTYKHDTQHPVAAAAAQVMSDFRPFFADKRNAKAVYRPSASATPLFAHAITLVGYNNQQQFWLAKNSYGSNWGDNGFFRVSLLLLVVVQCYIEICHGSGGPATATVALDSWRGDSM
jgi:hypothetical protein